MLPNVTFMGSHLCAGAEMCAQILLLWAPICVQELKCAPKLSPICVGAEMCAQMLLFWAPICEQELRCAPKMGL